ncbi:nudix hydrolase 9 isoform X4 [Magnolia sinica]|uniref:nudix hydrolase 9 isoform X4 n=1 Tax=Magnolia sinica TaxID=86752 RepID=UPI002659081E|nr:nudix hydrolase 9 isoform X4 [Magnolia sinica]
MEKSDTSVATEVDPPPTYRLLLTCPFGLSPAHVSVNFDASFDRIPHPDTTLEESILQIWNQQIQENSSLYNGKKFRYGGHIVHDVGGSKQESSVCLHLGLTDYRTFVGTNLNPCWEKFLIPSEAMLFVDDSVRCQHTSSPLGNGAIVETTDKRILVLQRSYNVGEFPGHFVFPGGHSETEPVFIGISRRELNVRPTAFFYLKCNLESKEIQQLYSTAQDGYESTQLYTVSRGELKNMASRMPGCHRGGFALYEMMVETAKDI